MGVTRRLSAWVPSVRIGSVRMLVVTAMAAIVAVMAGNVFDQLRPELLLPVAVAAVAVWVVLRLPVPVVLRGVVVAIAVVASAAVVAVLAGGTVADAVPGMVDGPRRMLTTEWPSPTDPSALAALAVLLGAATSVAADLACRPRLQLLPLLPIAVALVVVIALSAPIRPSWWLVAALGALALALTLARHGERAARRVASLLGERTVLVGVAAVAIASLATAALVTRPGRSDPRRIAEADRTATLIRSLEATVALRRADPPIDQFTVTDESPLVGARMPARWRTAALDTYDGQRRVPRTALRPIGPRLGVAADLPAGSRVRYAIELLTDRTELVPLPGPPIELASRPALGVETDLARVVVRFTDAAPAGTRLTLDAQLSPTTADLTAAALVPRAVDEVAAAFTDLAQQIAGPGSNDPLSQLQRIEREMRAWALDPEAPGGGQQQALIERFAAETNRGTAEQFTTAFVLLSRGLGYDARVATGFRVPAERATSPLTVTSADAAAWPEVNVAGVGWTAFDPVPDEVTGDAADPEPPPQSQTPAAAQPPAEPPAERDTTDPVDKPPEAVRDTGWGPVVKWAVRGAAVGAAALSPLVLAAAAIVGWKVARRRRRARAADPADLVRGAWANTTDALVDAGLAIEPSWTDDRIAAIGAPLVGPAPMELRRLAHLSTAATFGPAIGPGVADDAVLTENALRLAIAEQFTRWQRVRWRLSLRSLRRATRSPVSL